MTFCQSLTPEQADQFNAECVALVSAARGTGLHLCMQDLRELANQRLQKQLSEAIDNGQHS